MGTSEAFNYLTVLVSVLIGGGFSRLVAAIGEYVAGRRPVRRYWVHSVWVLILILLHVHVWWAFWELRGASDWSSRTFVWVLLGPAGLVIASHIVLPDRDDEHRDLERHYYDTSAAFFATLAGIMAWAQLSEWMLTSRPFFIPFRILPALAFCLVVACSLSKTRRLHGGVAVLLFLHFGIVLFVLRAYRE
jgi:hypothetical protein